MDVKWRPWLLILVLGGTGGVACGKKALPVGNCQNASVEGSVLHYQVAGMTIRLSWAVNREAYDVGQRSDRFKIQRAKISEDDCLRCPYRFHAVGDVVVPEGPKQDQQPVQLFFEDHMQAGYRYIYKVVGISEDSGRQVESNSVIYDCAFKHNP